jgi:DEAD/DEAH box helicase domain-containing protein
MNAFPVVIDIESKYTFRQFADPQKLGVSVAVLYDYADNQYHVFTEDKLPELFPRLEKASYVIGYNIVGFDLPVLQAYYHGSVSQFSTFDMLDDIKQTTGRRFSLNDVAASTLGVKKSGHGLQATEWFKTGEFDKIIAYCTDDVKITRQVFEYGCMNGSIYIGTGTQRSRIPTKWERYKNGKKQEEVVHTLPF